MNKMYFRLMVLIIVLLAVNGAAEENKKFDFARKLSDLYWTTNAEESKSNLNGMTIRECDARDPQLIATTLLKDAIQGALDAKPDFTADVWTAEQKQSLSPQISKLTSFYEGIENNKSTLEGKCMIHTDETAKQNWLTLKTLGRIAAWGTAYTELSKLSGGIAGLIEPLLTAAKPELDKIVSGLQNEPGQSFKECSESGVVYWPQNVKKYLQETSTGLRETKKHTTKFADYLFSQDEVPKTAIQEDITHMTKNLVALNFKVKKLSTLCRASAETAFTWLHTSAGFVDAYGILLFMLDPTSEETGPGALNLPDSSSGTLFGSPLGLPNLLNLQPVDRSSPSSSERKRSVKKRRRLKLTDFLAVDNICSSNEIGPAAITAPANMTRAIETGFGSINNKFDQLTTAVSRIAESVGSLVQVELFRMADSDRSRFLKIKSTLASDTPTTVATPSQITSDESDESTYQVTSDEEDETIVSADESVNVNEGAPSNMMKSWRPVPFVTPQGPSNIMSRSADESTNKRSTDGSSRKKRSTEPDVTEKFAVGLSNILDFLSGKTADSSQQEKDFQNYVLENYDLSEARPAYMTSSTMAPAALKQASWGKQSALDKESTVSQTLRDVLGWVEKDGA